MCRSMGNISANRYALNTAVVLRHREQGACVIHDQAAVVVYRTLFIKFSLRKAVHMFKTGEKPGKGHYYCSQCGQSINLDQDSDHLPPCPDCNNSTFDTSKSGRSGSSSKSSGSMSSKSGSSSSSRSSGSSSSKRSR